MAEAEEEGVPSEEQQQQLSSSSGGPEDTQPAARTEDTEKRAAEGEAAPSRYTSISVESSLDQFKIRRFFVLRVKTFTFPLGSRELDLSVKKPEQFCQLTSCCTFYRSYLKLIKFHQVLV